MSFLRSAALRASSLTRASRPAGRTAERAWQQAVQRRTYASGHGAHGPAQSSEMPWIAGGVAATVGGLYFVVTQDLGHGPGHDEDHHAEAHETHGKNEGQDEKDEDENKTGDGAVKSADSPDDQKDIAKDTATPKKKETAPEGKQSDKQPGSGRPEPGADKGAKAQESGEADPAKSDKADPRGKPKSTNETSGKQEGLSNSDTHHSSNISQQDEKSKKGEGVAETAKLKGTVSSDRPGAENKEERGKAVSDKN